MSPGTQAKITGSHERKEDVATTGSSQGNCQQADEAPQAGEENSEQLNNCNMLLASFKSQLKTQHSENQDHGIQSHHLMANRWRNNGNSDRLFCRAPKSL